jgi:hypothetical protein
MPIDNIFQNILTGLVPVSESPSKPDELDRKAARESERIASLRRIETNRRPIKRYMRSDMSNNIELIFSIDPRCKGGYDSSRNE